MKGFGHCNASIHFYIENIPPLEQYTALNIVKPLKAGEIANIAELTGNHWRKIFNVFAKLAFELESYSFTRWQELRDQTLLQQHSNYCLRFDAPTLKHLDNNKIHVILGKTYATKLTIAEQCHWLTPYMAINQDKRIIVCPYFDYRQLSNVKITQLVQLIKSLY